MRVPSVLSSLPLLVLPLIAQDPDLESRILEVYKPGRGPVNGPSAPAPVHTAVGGPALALPRDAGSHLEATRERWSLRAVLQAPSGQRIPLQVTFQRRRLATGTGEETWSRTQVLTAEAALCLGGGRRILSAERRGRLGLAAEAAEDRLRLRCDGWSLAESTEGRADLVLSFPEGRVRLSLTLPQAPISLPSLDPRDPLRRTARTGLEARGQMELQGQVPLDVKGRATLIQEWGPDLGEDQPGWDQGLLQLRDGRTWIYFNLRPTAGHTSSRALVAEVDAQGRLTKVQREPIISQRKTWQSSISGVRYPVALQFQVWNQILNLDPLAENQELRAHWSAGSSLWSGACRVRDGRNDEAGDAFLELTGYAHPMRGRF